MKVAITAFSESLGHAGRCFALGRELVEQGHEVVYAGSEKLFGRADLRPEGSAFVPLYEPPGATLADRMHAGRYIIEEGELSRMVRDDLDVLGAVGADVIVQDLRLSSRISAELLNLPTVALLCGRWLYPYSARPYALSRIDPVPPRIHGLILAGKKEDEIGLEARFERGRAILPMFHRVARALGASPRPDYVDYLMGDLNLILDIPSLGACRGMPVDSHLVGPLLWEPPVATPTWWGDYVSHTGPRIYVSLGSTASRELFSLVIQRFAGRRDYRIALATGGQVELPSRVSENMFSAPLLPGLALMRASDVAISHGGNLTFYQALEARCPLIAVSTHQEQELVAQDVDSLKLGRGFVMRDIMDRPGLLDEAVAAVLSDRVSYRERLHALSLDLSPRESVRRAARLIVAFNARRK